MKKTRIKHKASASPTLQTPESMAALASGMADEFNNILTTVMGACSLIDKDDPTNGDLHQYVALIRASAEHAAALSASLMCVGEKDQVVGRADRHRQNFTSVDRSVRDKKNSDGIVPSNNKPGGVTS